MCTTGWPLVLSSQRRGTLSWHATCRRALARARVGRTAGFETNPMALCSLFVKHIAAQGTSRLRHA
eukprot:743037-Pyramimonas_sp.AAC.1